MTLPCSDASRLRDEPLLATASRVERWLLVEHCGAWGPPAVPLARVDEALGRHLVAEAARLAARLVLLRHPPGVDCPPGRSVFVVDSVPGRESVRHRHFADDDVLRDVPLDADGSWSDVDQPLLLVCTHGRHDRCCAVRGRPVAEALAARWPASTWESSHVGGDRFAPNVVVLPAGWYVGQLDAANAVDAVGGLLAGRLPLTHLRGRSSLPLPVQAAQHFARTELARDDAGDLLLAAQTGLGTDAWRVRLTGTGGHADVEVDVRYDRAATEPALLTCNAQRESVAPLFRCERLAVLDG